MKLEFLLDTNIVSEPTRPRPNKNVSRRLKNLQGTIATAAVVWHELNYGCHLLPQGQKKQWMEKYLHEIVRRSLPILPYTAEAAGWHAAERSRLELTGFSPPYADGQIAAIAKVNGLVLVTNNVRDFERFEGLTIENWFR